VKVPDISVKDQIRKLVELQTMDGEIHNLKVELNEKPAVLKQLKDEFEAHKTALKVEEEKLKAIQLARKAKELELQAKEDDIAKSNAQLSQLKTNKEYTAKITEIENIKADKSVMEEKILMSYDESDAVNTAIEKEKIKLVEEEKNYLAKKKEAEETIKVVEERIKTLELQRQQVSPDVDPTILSRYERILRHKSGIAIVPVQKGSSCGGCFMNVTSQQVNAIKMNDQLIECEMCSRILYLEDDL